MTEYKSGGEPAFLTLSITFLSNVTDLKALEVTTTVNRKASNVEKAGFHPSGAAPLRTPGLPPLLRI